MAARQVSFDGIARAYRWMEYASFGRALERCRFAQIGAVAEARRALVYGDGDGRFLGRLLEANSRVMVDAVDSSAEMLRLAEGRAARLGSNARKRIDFHCADALAFEPRGEYDLVVTHFFLDCFSEREIAALLRRIGPHVRPGTRWLVSEFAVPAGGWMVLPSRVLIGALYGAFALLTGLRTRRLPCYGALLEEAGFVRRCERCLWGGLLRSELWQLPG